MNLKEISKNIPRFIVDAVKYFRLRFNLSLQEARQLVGKIIDIEEELYWLTA